MNPHEPKATGREAYLGRPESETDPTTTASTTEAPPSEKRGSAVLGFYERARERMMNRMRFYPQGVWGGMGSDME